MANTASQSDTLAICLSGGGLRATLFHLGVVRALRNCQKDQKRAIGQVGEIYSVSGGSILSAHMMLHWERYTGNEDDFAEVEQEILRFAQRNIRDRVLRRSVLTALPLFLWRKLSGRPVSGRTFWLRQEYKALLGNKTVQDSLRPAGKGPTLHILTTSFRTGELCSFSGNSFEIERRDAAPLVTRCDHIPLSFAVAASSAFPPMFPPLVVTDELLANPFDDAFLNPILLSDGGVYDNLGIEKFRKNMALPGLRPQSLIISNAGASFRASATKSYAGPLSRNVRASDILMHRVGDNAEDWINGLTSIDDTVVSISHTVDTEALDVTVQQRLRMVRTDLDRFSPALARLLIEHGERVASEALKGKGWSVHHATAPAALAGQDSKALHRLTGRAANRSFWSFFFDFRDLVPLATLWAITGLFGLGIYTLGYGYLDAKKKEEIANADLRVANSKLEAANIDHVKRFDASRNALAGNDLELLHRLLFDGLVNAQDKADADQKASTAAAATPSPQPTATASLPRVSHTQPVYIQFAGSLTRERIKELNRRLRDAGWTVRSTSGERTESARKQNEVRYSRANAEAARDLAQAVSSDKITGTIRVPPPNESIGGNLELWISN